MKQERAIVSQNEGLKYRLPLVALGILLLAVFAFGGGSRDDITSLIALRPIAVICLGIGLFTLTRDQWNAFRLPLAFMAAVIGLIILHLVPLPPALWMALPGRELAVAAGEAAGGAQPWRPLTLVPYRGWNAFYAMLVPAAAMVLAVQLNRDDHRQLVLLIIAAGMANALWGIIQSVGGFSPSLYFYSVTNSDSVTGLFANRNHMAALQVALLPLFALIGSRARGPRKNLVRTACAALGALAVMMALATGSRAGMAFAAFSIVASWLVWRARPQLPSVHRRGPAKQPWVPYAFAGFGAAVLAGFGILLTRSESFSRLSQTGSVEEFRFVVWETIAGFLPQYLPFGSGAGSFVEIFKVHEPSVMLSASYWNHAHNDWLEWALEGGVPAIILMAVAITGWARSTAGVIRDSHTGRFEVQLGIAGAIILFVLGLWSGVDYPLRVPVIACLAALCAVWLTLGNGTSGIQQGAGQTIDGPAKNTKGAVFKTRRVKQRAKGSDRA